MWLIDGQLARDQALCLAPGMLDGGQLNSAGCLPARRGPTDLRGGARGTAPAAGCPPGGWPPHAVRFTRPPCAGFGGPHGRPEAVGGTDVRFSLSHSGDLALIAIATKPVGVDVERIPAAETAASVAEVLHPYEAAELAALPADLRPAAVTRTWTPGRRRT